jgi:SAM-dependent methyltransferase
VIHHLPDPTPAFDEIARVVKPGGYFLIEFANYANFKNRMKHAAKFQRMPIDPVDIKTAEGNKKNAIPFVNHNPVTVRKQLAQSGFKVEKVLSVSNFRSQTLKKYIPKSTLVSLEKAVQKPLARTYFGPSTVYLLKKV